jgi:hypothetical protein
VSVLTACFAIAQVALLRSGRMIHDEGLLTWLYASYLCHDPVATLFFLKAKPVLAAFNLPGAACGLAGFYVGHVVIGCSGVVAMAAAARAARVREWGVAALLYAWSPMYVLGTAAGFSNVDAAALTAVAMWLIFRRPRPGFGAGLVLSLLPWVRFEAAVFTVVSALALLARDRSPRFLLGLVVLPAVYLSAGAHWHHDALWFWHFPATFARLEQTRVFGIAEAEVARTSVADLAFAVLTMTPVLAMAILPARGAPRWVHVGQLCTVLFVAGIVVLPLAGAAMGYSQRYFLQILPVAALLAAFQLERRAQAPALVGLGVLAASLIPFLWGASAGAKGVLTTVALVATIGLSALTWRRYQRLASAGATAFAVAWPFMGLPLDAPRPSRAVAGHVEEVVDWLRAHPEERVSPVVVTNLKLLDAYLTLSKDAPRLDVQCLVQTDNEYELTQLANPANGQRERLLALARWRFYGRGVLAREFAEHPAPPGALVVLRQDPRLGAVDPGALAAQGAIVLLRSDDLTILRLPR